MLTTALKRVPAHTGSTYVEPIRNPPQENEEPRSFWEKAALAVGFLFTFELALLALVGL
jgi:hypothetical protein